MDLKAIVLGLAEMAAAATAGGQHLTADEVALIASAESAAPGSVAKDATVAIYLGGNQWSVLRQGRNGFTCIPDVPESPGPDPRCLDEGAMLWLRAWIAHRAPVEGLVGFGYMLAGGSDPDNIDPYAMRPGKGRAWVQTGPQVRLFNIGQMANLYPTGVQPDTSEPFVMYPDTPYEQLVLPVR